MKVVRLICCLLLTAVICGSCNKKDLNSRPIDEPRALLLSFRDAAANDLVKGIEFDADGYADGLYGVVMPELYALYYVYEDGDIPDPWQHNAGSPQIDLRKSGHTEALGAIINDDYDYLLFHTLTETTQPFVEKITLKLKCPYLFGDNETHDIDTWWKQSSKGDLCYRIDFDGKEYTEIVYDKLNPYPSIATIILDK